MAVNGTTISIGVNQAAQNAGYSSRGTLDVSALAAFNTNVTTFNMGVGSTTTGVGNVLLSNTANTIQATAASGAAASFYSVTGATFDDNTSVTTGGNGFGFYATGNNSGTLVRRNVFTNNTVGVYLNAATNIVFGTSGTPADGNTISLSSFAGLQAAGACTNSFVYDTTWTSNAQNVFSTATGLTINPPAP